jgi:hypothetical protein
MRDLSNTFFIFILLYIAISTILQTAGGQTKRLLATLVLAALFMNFSLYITKFVIDIGNVFALELYTNIASPSTSNYITIQGEGAINPILSIAAGFNSYFNIDSLIPFIDSSDVVAQVFVYGMAGVMYMVAAFVFLSAGFLFLARVVAFWLLMILSPLAFFSMILPYTRGKIWSRWSSELVSQSFFAPIFLFFVYISLILLKTILFSKGITDGDFIQQLILIFLNFFAVITILLFGLKTAKGMSGELGASMTKIGGTVTGTAIGAGLGATAWAGRNSLGLGMRKFLEAKDADGRSREDRMRASRSGNLLLKSTGDLGTKSSFDLRGIGGVGTLAKMGGLDIGQAAKGGQAVQFAEKVKAREAEYNKIQDPKLRAKYLHSLHTGALPSDKDVAFALYSKMSSKDRMEMASKATDHQDMFQGFAKKLDAKSRSENHKEALANAKDARDPRTGLITKSKDAVRAEYLHGMEDFGTSGLSGQELADQRAKNRIAQREAIESMSSDDVSDMLTAAKNSTSPTAPAQVLAINEAIARSGHEKQVSFNQAILRDVREKIDPLTGKPVVDPATGKSITSASQRADIINGISNPDIKKALWAKESAEMRAEMLAVNPRLDTLESTLSPEQREQTRTAKINVQRRSDVADKKERIQTEINAARAAGTPLSATALTNIENAIKGLKSGQRALLEPDILKNPAVSRHLNLEDLKAISARDELKAPEQKKLVEEYINRVIPLAATDAAAKNSLVTLNKSGQSVLELLDPADRTRVANAVNQQGAPATNNPQIIVPINPGRPRRP